MLLTTISQLCGVDPMLIRTSEHNTNNLVQFYGLVESFDVDTGILKLSELRLLRTRPNEELSVSVQADLLLANMPRQAFSVNDTIEVRGYWTDKCKVTGLDVAAVDDPVVFENEEMCQMIWNKSQLYMHVIQNLET
jgi:hypothetical protein